MGYTNNPRTRLNAHIKHKYNQRKDMIINDIILNDQKPTLNIIDECDYCYNTKECMFEHEKLEIYYIKKCGEIGIELTNMTDGGGNTIQSLKKRIYKYSQFGKFIKEYSSISEAGIEHKINPDNIGHAVDQRIKKTSCGYYWFTSKERANNFKFKLSMKDDLLILQYSLNGDFIRGYKNKNEFIELQKIFSPSRKKVKQRLLNRALLSAGKKSSCGYLWFYTENLPNNIKLLN